MVYTSSSPIRRIWLRPDAQQPTIRWHPAWPLNHQPFDGHKPLGDGVDAHEHTLERKRA